MDSKFITSEDIKLHEEYEIPHWRLWSRTTLKKFGWKVASTPVAQVKQYDLYDWADCKKIRGQKAKKRRRESGFTDTMRQEYLGRCPPFYRQDLHVYGCLRELNPAHIKSVKFNLSQFALHPLQLAAHLGPYTLQLTNAALAVARICLLNNSLVEFGLGNISLEQAMKAAKMPRLQLINTMEKLFGEDWPNVPSQIQQALFDSLYRRN